MKKRTTYYKPKPKYHEQIWKAVKVTLLIAFLVWFFNGLYQGYKAIPQPAKLEIKADEVIIKTNYEREKIEAYITGYNSLESQTDETPCIGAGGHICGREDVVACPRQYELGTKVVIAGKQYECLDRLSRKYDNRFDIFCDKDLECPYKVTGWKEVEIL